MKMIRLYTETQITSTPGGRQSFAPFPFWNFMGAKDCLPPGVEVIWVSGRVAKLTFDLWNKEQLDHRLPKLKIRGVRDSLCI